MVCTGTPTSLAILTACGMKSCTMPRRPKPPPSIILWTLTFFAGTPAAAAATESADSPCCVGTQISARPPMTCAVQFCGSSVAWAR